MGEYVFKADTSLTSLYIPDCTVQIGAGLFQDAIANVTLYVAENSYAQSYAKKYGIAYETRKAKLTVVASGTCGENAAWTLDSEGVLNITGDGPMADNNTNQAPWEAYKYQIKQIVISLADEKPYSLCRIQYTSATDCHNAITAIIPILLCDTVHCLNATVSWYIRKNPADPDFP